MDDVCLCGCVCGSGSGGNSVIIHLIQWIAKQLRTSFYPLSGNGAKAYCNEFSQEWKKYPDYWNYQQWFIIIHTEASTTVVGHLYKYTCMWIHNRHVLLDIHKFYWIIWMQSCFVMQSIYSDLTRVIPTWNGFVW